jgi:hypothetical protein
VFISVIVFVGTFDVLKKHHRFSQQSCETRDFSCCQIHFKNLFNNSSVLLDQDD